MGKNKTKTLLSPFFSALLIALLVFSFSNLEIEKVQAGTGDNVYGWAWSENIGWISFNNTSGGGSVDYGVNIGSDGILSGYAWSENIGWISFADFDGDGDVDAADKNIPGSPCAPNCEAKIDLMSGEVSGWARALAYGGGWDGWIRLRGSNYGVNLNTGTHEFKGWAWGGDVIGWISFNCNNPETGNVCSTSNYKVKTSFTFNSPPTATNLTVTPLDYCINSLPTRLFWTFSDLDPDDTQGAYQVQIDNNSNFSSPEVDSGKVYSSSGAYTASGISYNTAYYWRLKVWDNNGADSGWIYPTPSSFDTPSHTYPDPDFTWSPSSPSVGEVVQFCAVQESGVCLEDESTCYNTSGAIPSPSCSGKSFRWSFSPGTVEYATGTSPTSENPRVKFLTQEPYTATLQITDDLGTCSITKQIRVTFPLPEWQETAP